MKGKRRRFWEGCKTLLIILLSCSTVFLASRTLLPQGGRTFLSRLSPSATGSVGSLDSLTRSAQTLQPAAFAVTWTEGRYAVLYHQEDQEGYTQISALLSEALNDAATPVPVTARQWELVLSQPGAFCESPAPSLWPRSPSGSPPRTTPSCPATAPGGCASPPRPSISPPQVLTSGTTPPLCPPTCPPVWTISPSASPPTAPASPARTAAIPFCAGTPWSSPPPPPSPVSRERSPSPSTRTGPRTPP